MLKDSDARIRNEAANAILEFNRLQLVGISNEIDSITVFAAEILSNEVPFSLNHPLEPLHGCQFGFNCTETDGQLIKRVLGTHLFDVTNMLFDLKSNEQLVRNAS